MGSAASSSKRDESPAGYKKRMHRLPNGELKSVLRELDFGLTTGVPHPSHIDLSGVSLSMSSSRYGPEGLEVLAHYMGRNATVKVLNLARCELCMHELSVLVRSLAKHPCLRELHLPHNTLSSNSANYAFHKLAAGDDFFGLCELADAVRTHASLTMLDLSHSGAAGKGTPVDGGKRDEALEGVEALASAVATNTKLRRIALHHTMLDLAVLRGTDTDNDALTNLDLHDIGLSASDAVVIAAVLPQNKVTTALDLSDNALGDGRAAELLVACLHKNTHLTSLRAANVGFGPRAAGEVAKYLRSCRALHRLDLCANSIGAGAGTDLVDALSANASAGCGLQLDALCQVPLAELAHVEVNQYRLLMIDLTRSECSVAAQGALGNGGGYGNSPMANSFAAISSRAGSPAGARPPSPGSPSAVLGTTLASPPGSPTARRMSAAELKLDKMCAEAEHVSLLEEGRWLGVGGVALLGRYLAEFPNAVRALRLYSHWLPIAHLKGECSDSPDTIDLSACRLWCGDVLVVAHLLRRNCKLRSLGLSDNCFVDFDLRGGCYNFDALDALGDALRNDNEGNTSLTALSLRNNRLCGAGYGSETSGTRFAETDNSGMLRFATALAKNGSVTRLDLGDNKLSDDALRAVGQAAFAKASALCYVDVSSWATSHDSRNLDLQNHGITPSNVHLLSGVLRSNRTLTSLCLSRNRIGCDGAASLGRALMENSSLVHLKLGYAYLGDSGVEYIARALDRNRFTAVESLDLTNNALTFMGAREIGAMLLRNRSLRSLTLRCNGLMSKGAALLAEALKHNDSLTHLDVAQNGMLNEAAAMLAHMVVQSDSLASLVLHRFPLPLQKLKGVDRSVTALNFSQSNLQPHDTIIIAALMEENTTVRALDLSLNNVGGWNFKSGIEKKADPSGLEAIRHMLHINTTLRTLKLTSNNFDEECLATLSNFPKNSECKIVLEGDEAEGLRAFFDAGCTLPTLAQKPKPKNVRKQYPKKPVYEKL